MHKMEIGVHQGAANESSSLRHHALIKLLVLKELEKFKGHYKQLMDEQGFFREKYVHHHPPKILENPPPADALQEKPPFVVIEKKFSCDK